MSHHSSNLSRTSPAGQEVLVGLDVGGTMIKAMAFAANGDVLAEKNVPTGDDGTKAWLENARTVSLEIAARWKESVLAGVAAPGLAAPDRSSITFMPVRLPGLVGLNWQEWLSLNRPVPVFNDAQAALLGETWLGSAKSASNVVLLTLGTGVGGAAMVDGRVLRGHIGRAGHLGHVSLNPEGPRDIVNAPGSLEDAIGDHNLAARSGGRYTTTRELVADFRAGLPEAKSIWLRSVRALAAAIAGFINVLDPEFVVIGGGIADADDMLFTPLNAALDEFEWRPGGHKARVVKAALGRNAGAAGAAYGAKLMAAKKI